MLILEWKGSSEVITHNCELHNGQTKKMYNHPIAEYFYSNDIACTYFRKVTFPAENVVKFFIPLANQIEISSLSVEEKLKQQIDLCQQQQRKYLTLIKDISVRLRITNVLVPQTQSIPCSFCWKTSGSCYMRSYIPPTLWECWSMIATCLSLGWRSVIMS